MLAPQTCHAGPSADRIVTLTGIWAVNVTIGPDEVPPCHVCVPENLPLPVQAMPFPRTSLSSASQRLPKHALISVDETEILRYSVAYVS